MGSLFFLVCIYLATAGIRKMHTTTTGRALLMVLQPTILILVLVVVLVGASATMHFSLSLSTSSPRLYSRGRPTRTSTARRSRAFHDGSPISILDPALRTASFTL
jgi:hypothetical protein